MSNPPAEPNAPDPIPASPAPATAEAARAAEPATARPREIGGPKGLEPTRYGDWERKGRCIDF
ncbi:MAG: DUF1674 domain-containing protein [Gammaproteobacteria bacterium]